MADNDDLVTLKNNFTFLHPDEPWRGSYVLVVDSDMPFGLVARVMRWAEAAGYYQPQYAVQHSFFEDPATQ